MGDLTSLIERIEAATEGSRELDAKIAAKLRMCPINEEWVHNWTGEWRAINGLVHLIGDYGSSGNFRPREYTTSIDAALTLLPEGYAVTGLMIWPGERSSVSVIETRYRPFGKDRRMSWVREAGCRQWPGDGVTAPLALLAAILRARHTEGR